MPLDKVNLGCETPKMRKPGEKFQKLFFRHVLWGGRIQRSMSDHTLLSQALVFGSGWGTGALSHVDAAVPAVNLPVLVSIRLLL